MSGADLGERQRLLLARSSLLRTSLALQTELILQRGRAAARPARLGAWLGLALLLMWRPRRSVRAAFKVLAWVRLLWPLLRRV